MVRIQDGTMVMASELFGNNVEDDDDQKLKFEQVKDSVPPRFKAETKMKDGSERKRIYSFSFDEVLVRVHMAIIDEIAQREAERKAKETEAAATEKSTKEVSPQVTTATSSSSEAKKNTSQPDYRVGR